MWGAWRRPTSTPDQHPWAQLSLLHSPLGTLVRRRTELGLWRQRRGVSHTLDDLRERAPCIPTLPPPELTFGHSPDPPHNVLAQPSPPL